jgi:trk system potassium uptake protein TrkA
VMRKAAVEEADLLLACSSREEANLVCALLTRRISRAKTVVRTTSIELLDAWRESEIDVDFMISPELETANAIAGIVGLPAARQTDVFADGRIQVVEFAIPADAADDAVIGRPLRDAALPAESKVAGLIRGERMIFPSGDERVQAGDRVVVIASMAAARDWSQLLSRHRETVDDVVIFGAGAMGTTIAASLLQGDVRVRLVDADSTRAQKAAEALPHARVFHADASDAAFLERQRIRHAAAVFCMNNDPRNLYSAVLAKVHGAPLTIALVHDPAAALVYERGGVDVAINPREVTAEEMVRFAHDPRVRQIAMLDSDRIEILDITVRPDSPFADMPFGELPAGRSVIGAVIRDNALLFPHSSDRLRAGDRVIVCVGADDAIATERAL